MKKVLIAFAVILVAGFFLYANKAAFTKSRTDQQTIAGTNGNEKVTICHRTGNGGSHPITVSINAVPAHLAHGDAIGDCGGGQE